MNDRIQGALLGTAVGDALGMPVEGISHQNVRTYYLGIKEYRDDEERRDLQAGQWTDDTQMTFALVRAMTGAPPAAWPDRVAAEYVALRDEARRWGPTTTAAIDRLAEGVDPSESGDAEHPTNGAAMRAAPLGLWWAVTDVSADEAAEAMVPVLAVTHRHPRAMAAGLGQAAAVRAAVQETPDGFDRERFWVAVIDGACWAESTVGADDVLSTTLERLHGHLDDLPLDLRDACGGVGVRAEESWPFACAMAARRAHLLENTLLSGINVGGDADTTGAMMGALLGAVHGWRAFPEAWGDGLEARTTLAAQADAFAADVQARVT